MRMKHGCGCETEDDNGVVRFIRTCKPHQNKKAWIALQHAGRTNPMAPELPRCFDCKYRIKNEDGYYCKKLEHPLENGVAMRWHSTRCGE